MDFYIVSNEKGRGAVKTDRVFVKQNEAEIRSVTAETETVAEPLLHLETVSYSEKQGL